MEFSHRRHFELIYLRKTTPHYHKAGYGPNHHDNDCMSNRCRNDFGNNHSVHHLEPLCQIYRHWQEVELFSLKTKILIYVKQKCCHTFTK